MNKIFKNYGLLVGIYFLSTRSPSLGCLVGLGCCTLMYKYLAMTKPVLVGSRLDSQSLQLETFLRMKSISYYHLQHLGPIEYLAVFFGGYFTKDDLFTKPILINPPSSKFTEPRSSGVQTFVDDFLGVMFDEFVPLLADMDHDAMAVGFVDEHGGMLPLSIQSQMILAYKYHAKRRYLEGISKEQVLGLLHGKSRKEVLEELMKVLEEFFSKKSLLLDTWTRSTAALFARILLLRKYSSLVKSQTEFKEKYTALSMWIDGVESSLHGDVFPFPNTLTKIDMDIHLHALRPLLTFAKAYFVPFLLLDGERYKYLIDGYDAYAQQLCT